MTVRAARRKGTVRFWLRRVLVAAILILVLTTGSVTPEQQFDLQLSPLIGRRGFDWFGWEADAIGDELGWWLQGSPLPGDAASQRGEVLDFVARQQRLQDLERRARRVQAEPPEPRLAAPATDEGAVLPAVAALQDQMDALYRRQVEASWRVEHVMAAQVSRALVAQGLGTGGVLLPPVAFRFNEMPTYLVVSPRKEIRLYRGAFLLPELGNTDRVDVESVVEASLGVSALVDDVGGIGSWPTMIIRTESLLDLLDTVAHEWTHTYLLFHPLGANYDVSRDLTTMNETVASLAGAEVADLVLADSYPDLIEANTAGNTGSSKPSAFSLAMRRIRLHVDELLAAGQVQEAETFMEAERERLVAEGYSLRRLNQAYFAFHGSYATSPTSVDPIGPWMRQLRAQSGSLKAFLERVAPMQSLDDLLSALGEQKS